MIPQHCFCTDAETVIEIFELAKSRGKQRGDSCQAEFEEILKQKPEKFVYLGSSDKDIDLLCGELRERGLKILNLKEQERKKNV